MIQRVLIANRGEVAVRIIRACRELNLSTVAIYSDVDKHSLHVLLADEAVCIGDFRLENSYLNQQAILQAAINTKCHAIHPGFGFLSENAEFAQACERLGLEFIGPDSQTITLMGNKQNARETMLKAGVPCVPGSDGLISTVEEALKVSNDMGYPVLIKAAMGGGGKGMRVAYSADVLPKAFEQAKQEAQNAFGNGDVYIEKFIEKPRHIEVQILGDKFGNVVHLFERECSVQRNNQKMIEEAPVKNLSKKTREALYNAALNAGKFLKYESLGTLEFIMDQHENFYFIEMNTRLQVEHPITEMITGIDLVKAQLLVASNRPLPYKQADIKKSGHAIELRITSENPYENFMPSSGKIENIHFPGGLGVRVDSFIYPGYEILPFYDSMMAKIIVFDETRDGTIEKAIRCLEELDIEGIQTNIEFLLEVLLHESFLDLEYDTSLIQTILKS